MVLVSGQAVRSVLVLHLFTTGIIGILHLLYPFCRTFLAILDIGLVFGIQPINLLFVKRFYLPKRLVIVFILLNSCFFADLLGPGQLSCIGLIRL